MGCGQKSLKDEQNFDKQKQDLITDFSTNLFNKDKINSREVLDSLKLLSNDIYPDTAKYFRTPKATIYSNNSTRTYFQVFEKPKGTITVIAFYKSGKKSMQLSIITMDR